MMMKSAISPFIWEARWKPKKPLPASFLPLYTAQPTIIWATAYWKNICSRLDTELLIANIITEEADLDKITTPDFIICTVPINRSLVTPFVQVQPFLMESDVIAIRQKINEIRTSKKRETFTSYLHQIILPDFFERGEGFPDQEEAIHYLCEKFRQKGYVEEQFETEVLEREEMSSTGFQNFAIPHSMRMRAKKTGMYLYLCDTPHKLERNAGLPDYHALL